MGVGPSGGGISVTGTLSSVSSVDQPGMHGQQLLARQWPTWAGSEVPVVLEPSSCLLWELVMDPLLALAHAPHMTLVMKI